MNSATRIDGVLVQWGERLFYPPNRIVKADPAPRLDTMTRRKAVVIRARIEAAVRRVPQVMVKVTSGGRGMGAIAAHFRYISKNGRLDIEDDRGVARNGREAVRDLADQWRFGCSLIGETGYRREALYITLSMPAGTNAALLHRAAREFAQAELAGYRYVMVLHQHQANPHVHLSVKIESATGRRLRPCKSDLYRWRETFAEKLRGWGIEAEATRQASRGTSRNYDPLWRVRARQAGRLQGQARQTKSGPAHDASRSEAMVSWAHIMKALAQSEIAQDRELAARIGTFVQGMPFLQQQIELKRGPPERNRLQQQLQPLRRADHVDPGQQR